MPRASHLLSESQVDLVNQTLCDARKRTSATILPVVARSTGRYDRAEDLVGLWAAALGLALTWAVFSGAPVGNEWAATLGTGRMGLLPILGVLVGGFLCGLFLASRIGWLQRLFVPRRQMVERANARAGQVLLEYSQRLPEQDRNRVLLIYVTAYERIVALAAGDAMDGRLTDADLESIRGLVAQQLPSHKLDQGLRNGIARATELLAGHFPPESNPAWSSEMRLRVLD
jgi:putative membrane protein